MSSSQKHLPYFAEGTVVSGFGRGSKELGIPTANFADDVIQNLPADFECGVYYGWAKVNGDESIYQMVHSIGWNPYYHNTVKTMETHILHKFDHDFYGDHLKTIILGYIRPMCNFDSLDALITAIHKDIAEAVECLKQPACLKYSSHPFFSQSPSDTAPAGHSSGSIPDLASNCCSQETGLLDIHNNHSVKHKSRQNGLVPALHTDSTNLDKCVNHCYNTDMLHCENNHNGLAGHAEDNVRPVVTKGSRNHAHEISINGHSEAEDSSACTLIINQ